MIKKIIGKILIHVILIITSLLSIFPFIWLTSTSLKGLNEALRNKEIEYEDRKELSEEEEEALYKAINNSN